MKPFDLEAAKKGAKVCTRNGLPARIVTFSNDPNSNYPIIAIIRDHDAEFEFSYSLDGFFNIKKKGDLADLVMADE